jgi:sulfhydrogenase subunit beta (sulfur reductase)
MSGGGIPRSAVSLPRTEFDRLLAALRQRGYRALGPRRRNESLEYGPIERVDDLPVGLISVQSPGRFRLSQQEPDRVFDAIPAADSWKRFTFPPRSSLCRVDGDADRLELTFPDHERPPMAWIGVRACELAALSIQDRIFLRPGAIDPIYRSRRRSLFIVAVDCHHPASTCFCASMGTGPSAVTGFDLALSELGESFLVRVGSNAGADLVAALGLPAASDIERAEAGAAVERARDALTRRVATDGLPERLLSNLEHPRWDQVAKRCLSCTNCTLVCPTCFCWDVSERTLWDGGLSERVRLWDSCFNPDHSYHAGGGATRPTVRSRYRQWLTHKFASWVSQFGVSGCVGCGRCITWCPAGIDVTEELAAIAGGGER